MAFSKEEMEMLRDAMVKYSAGEFETGEKEGEAFLLTAKLIDQLAFKRCQYSREVKCESDDCSTCKVWERICSNYR